MPASRAGSALSGVSLGRAGECLPWGHRAQWVEVGSAGCMLVQLSVASVTEVAVAVTGEA